MTNQTFTPSARAQILTRRTYNRPIGKSGQLFEIWEQTLDRVISHQRWLWTRAQGDDLEVWQEQELSELKELMLGRAVSTSGRTLWLGGTDLVKRREASMFSCSFVEVRTVHDLVDGFWLLLQGCVPPDTPVLTESGPVRIDQIKIGDRVWSYNKETGQKELEPVTMTHDVHVAKEDNLRVNCRHGSFVTSTKHPVLVRRDGAWEYVPAGTIKPSDTLQMVGHGHTDLTPDLVLSVEREIDVDPGFKDLTVGNNHSYMCGYGSYYVLHNCGLGFKPSSGVLSGFVRKMEVEIVRSTRTVDSPRGREHNEESYDPNTKTWTIDIGDSAEAWAKSIGKIVAGKYPAKKLRIVLAEIRAAGQRLTGYGWLCSGDAALAQAYQAICQIMNTFAGKLLTKQALWDIVNWLGTVLSSRRSAQIGLIDYGDPEWEAVASRKYKGFDKGPDWYRGQSNNTVVFHEKPSKRVLSNFFDLMIENGGSEPGLFNMKAALARAPWVRGTNPCLVGSTQVYVADGRREVTIGQLASEGKDVPVFCVDKDNHLTVRTLRHPRLTGVRKKIYRVDLDNGGHIRVTGNHRFRLKDGAYREAKNLQPGDSLAVLTTYLPEQCLGDSYADKYVSLLYQDNQRPYEHREIAAFHAGRELLEEDHVHHVNEDRLDNDPGNLQVLPAAEHLSGHSTGASNPNASNVTNEDLIRHGRTLSVTLKRRFSKLEWQAYARDYKLPLHFSEWRAKSLGSVEAFAKRCAALEGFCDVEADPRVVRTYHAMLEAGLDAEIVNNTVLIHKKCEVCGDSFSIEHLRREQCVCSHSCGNRNREMDKVAWKTALTDSHAARKKAVRERQVQVWLALRTELKRRPFKKEWVVACKTADVSPEIARPSSPFPSWETLTEAAETFNHKVVAVVEDGFEDVYNGTVDDHHNFFVGGWDEGLTEQGRRKLVWLNNLQCGEILLPNCGFCNLAEIDLAKFRGDHLGLHQAAYLIARANYRQTCVNLRDGILQSAWHETNEYLRLCGVGVTGICRRPDMEAWDYRQLKYAAISAAYSMADELGTERPKNVTTVKPSGCRPWYALTTTDKGLLTLQEQFEDHPDGQAWGVSRLNARALLDDKTCRISRTYVNGVKPVYRVTMSYGLVVESTGNHPWFVKARKESHKHGRPMTHVNKWVKTEELAAGDVLELKLGAYNVKESAKLRGVHTTAIRMRGDHAKIDQPTELCSDLCWLLGYVWGDGAQSVQKYRLRFVDGNEACIRRAAELVKRFFGLTAEVRRLPDREAFSYEVGSKVLWMWMQKNGLNKYEVDEKDDIELIPKVVRSSSRDDIIAFLAGLLDADGSATVVDGERKNVVWTTASSRLAQHVQDVAWAVGLGVGRSLNSLGKNFQDNKEMYLLTLGTHVLRDAAARLVEYSTKTSRLEEEEPELDWNFEREPANKRVAGKVVSVELVGEMPTFDVEVLEEHWFYAGAVKSHNTLSKVMDTTEGAHKPKGRYIFNNVAFSRHDPLVRKLLDANYRVQDHPTDKSSVLVTLPVAYPDVKLEKVGDHYLDTESAVTQLERYKLLQDNYTDQNTSITVSYAPEEKKAVVAWFDKNWDHVVATSFLFRADPFKTASDLGFSYLPQEVVTKDAYDSYEGILLPVDLEQVGCLDTELEDKDCPGGVCPVR